MSFDKKQITQHTLRNMAYSGEFYSICRKLTSFGVYSKNYSEKDTTEKKVKQNFIINNVLFCSNPTLNGCFIFNLLKLCIIY